VTDHVTIGAPRGRLTTKQREVLLQGINTDRVSQRAAEKGSRVMLSYLEQADVRAHADRIFGHGGWDCETLDVTMIFEEERSDGRWLPGYRVTMQVTIYDPEGLPVCRYSETAVGTPMGAMKDRGDAHDMAIKTAASDAMKRCFINLGDQFGLSLYWKGRTAPVVITTLVTGDALPEAIPPVPPEESSDSEPGPQPPQEDPRLPEDIPTQSQPGIPEETFNAALDEIRVAAVVPDSGIRLLALAGIKGRYAPAVLDRTTTVRGATITLGALIDRASVGEFVPAEEPSA
jgi:hypothetical protein